jgi:hypothetical protein
VDTKSLNGIPLFAELSKKDREQIARWADEIDEPAGFRLVDQGRFAHSAPATSSARSRWWSTNAVPPA